ncbi:MAG: hypothetical protein PVS2B2_27760 [Candidatus Acidiferrum sp.]
MLTMSRARYDLREDAPAELARELPAALQRARIIPRFVDCYVVEHGRYGLQVHAALYRDLLALLQREALLTLSVRALDLLQSAEQSAGASRVQSLSRKDAAVFRRKFLTALSRQHGWNAGDSLDFQSDLQMYQDLLAYNGTSRRARKPFESANHPFVDRCAFLLDSSFLEKARLAASHALTDLEELADQMVARLHEPKIVHPPR